MRVNKNTTFLPLWMKKKKKKTHQIFTVAKEERKGSFVTAKKSTSVILHQNNLWHVLHITYSERQGMPDKGSQPRL